MKLLSKDIIEERIKNLREWNYIDSHLEKEFSFNDFVEAMSFVTSVALEAEKMDHHPDLLIHGWNKVKISISTHSEGGVTNLDFDLAEKIESRLN